MDWLLRFEVQGVIGMDDHGSGSINYHLILYYKDLGFVIHLLRTLYNLLIMLSVILDNQLNFFA